MKLFNGRRKGIGAGWNGDGLRACSRMDDKVALFSGMIGLGNLDIAFVAKELTHQRLCQLGHRYAVINIAWRQAAGEKLA